MTTLFL